MFEFINSFISFAVFENFLSNFSVCFAQEMSFIFHAEKSNPWNLKPGSEFKSWSGCNSYLFPANHIR